MNKRTGASLAIGASLIVVVFLLARLGGETSPNDMDAEGGGDSASRAGEAEHPHSSSAETGSTADSDEDEEARPHRVSGRVLDEMDEPVPGASVRLRSFGEAEVLVTSGAEGEFEASVEESLPLVVNATAEGYVRASLTLRTHEQDIEIVMRRGRQISGTVVADDEPVVGATVVAGPARTQAGSGGTFVLENLPPGPIAVEARHGAARSLPLRLDLSEGPAHGVTLVLRPAGSLLVRVRTTDGEPVAGAAVTFTPHGWNEPREATANDEGDALLEAVPAGSGRATASKEGLASAQTNIEVPPEDQADTTLRLSEAHDVVVHTRLDQGAPEAFERVSLRLVPGDGTAAPAMQTHYLSIGIGEAAVFHGVAEGAWRVIAHHPTYSADPEPVEVPGPDVTLTLEAGGSISGRVLDDERRPLAGAFVIATPSLQRSADRTELRPARRARSDERGRFEIEGVGAGAWRLVPRLQGYQPSDPVEARKGDRDVVIVMEETLAIQGEVVDGRGSPMESIRVVARAVDEDRTRVARAVTEEDGSFRIDDLSPGRYEVYAARSQRHSARRVVEAGRNGVRLTIPFGATVRGRVVGPNGVPPFRYTVLGYSFSDETGAFEIEDLDPRQTTIWFEAPDLLRKEIVADLRDDRVTDLGTIELPAPARLEGIIESEERGPIDGVTVVLEVLEDKSTHPAITSTDEDGRFSFGGLRLGLARVHATSDSGESSALETELRSGETEQVRLTLP